MSSTHSNTSPEARLEALGLELPPVPGAVSNYSPTMQTGNLVYTSGQLPWIDGDLKYEGQMGKDGELSDEDGYNACRLSALNAIALLKHHLDGDLTRVRQIVRLEGVLNVKCDSRWTGQPKALDGASDLIIGVFGEKGMHTRMIYSNSAMPLDCASLVHLIVEVD